MISCIMFVKKMFLFVGVVFRDKKCEPQICLDNRRKVSYLGNGRLGRQVSFIKRVMAKDGLLSLFAAMRF